MSDDPLKPLLDAVGIDEAHVGPAEMNTLAKRITAASEAFILFPTLAPGLADDQQRPPDYFEIHDREWWIDARGPAGREYLTTLITAAAIRARCATASASAGRWRVSSCSWRAPGAKSYGR